MMKKIFIKDNRLRSGIYILLIIFPLLASLFALSLGRMRINPIEIIKFFISYINGDSYDPMLESVIINIRLARIITALIVGAGLSAAGLAFQGIFSNPIATPDILGVSSCASLGAVIAILLSLSTLAIQFIALVFGIIGVFLTSYIGKSRGKTSIIMLILAGIVITSLSNAFSSLLKYTADPTDKLPAITYWLMGSFARSSYDNLLLAGPFIILATLFIGLSSFKLNIMSLSEDEAKSLGIDFKKTRASFILASTLITASSVSLCGQVGWIGLIIPHISRMIIGSNNTLNFPLVVSIGAGLMVLIEALSRSISVIELPISILTAIIGAPIFIILIKRTEGGLR